jgi:hypothetical protein
MISRDLSYVDSNWFAISQQEIMEISKMLRGLRTSVEGKS